MKIRKYQHEGAIQRNDGTIVSKPFVTNLPTDDSLASTILRNYILRKRSRTNEEREREEFYRRAHDTGEVSSYDEEARRGWMEVNPLTGELTYHSPTITTNPLERADMLQWHRMWNSPALNLAINIPLGELTYMRNGLVPKPLQAAAKKAYTSPTVTVNQVESGIHTSGRKGHMLHGVHKDKGLSTPFTEELSFAILEPAKRHAETQIIKPSAQTAQTDQTLFKDLPGTSDSWYRVVDEDTFNSYVTNGVVSLYNPKGRHVSQWPNPMFTHGFIADQRRTPGSIVLVSRPNTSLVFDANAGPGVTPLFNGKTNAAPLSEFDIFKITPEGFVKVGADYNIATEVPDYVSYLKTLPFNERLAIYRKAGIDSGGAEWALRNRPSGLLFQLLRSGIPVPDYDASLIQEDVLTEVIPKLLRKPYTSPRVDFSYPNLPKKRYVSPTIAFEQVPDDPIRQKYLDELAASMRLRFPGRIIKDGKEIQLKAYHKPEISFTTINRPGVEEVYFNDLPGTANLRYKVVDDYTLRKYLEDGVVTESHNHYPVDRNGKPEFTRSDVLRGIHFDRGATVLVSKEGKGITWDGRTPIFEGLKNNAPLSAFDLFRITPEGKFIKLNANYRLPYGISVGIPDYGPYIESLSRPERIELLRRLNVDSRLVNEVANHPNYILRALEKAKFEIPQVEE